MADLVQVLMRETGMSFDEMMESAVMDGVAPALCVNCHATTNMEPDQDEGYCEECGENSVVSCCVLAGIM